MGLQNIWTWFDYAVIAIVFAVCRFVYRKAKATRAWWRENGTQFLLLGIIAVAITYWVTTKAGATKAALSVRVVLAAAVTALYAVSVARSARRRLSTFASSFASPY